jgi:hypothetical protein
MTPILLFGEPIDIKFFIDLLEDRDSKYLTNFKKYFNYLKKNHIDYKSVTIKDKVSLDKPLVDYVFIINDWLDIETKGKYQIYMNKFDKLFFGYRITNPVNADNINYLCKEWKKNKKFRDDYYNWISNFDDTGEGPLLFGLY